jgi:fatty acid desaturase
MTVTIKKVRRDLIDAFIASAAIAFSIFAYFVWGPGSRATPLLIVLELAIGWSFWASYFLSLEQYKTTKKKSMPTNQIEARDPAVLKAIIALLAAHGFRDNGYHIDRPSTGCSFPVEELAKYETVTDFQLDYPYYATR